MKLNRMLVFLLSILLISFLAMGCGESTSAPENDVDDGEAAAPSDDQEVYTGEAEGGHGPVIVEVTMAGDEIVKIEVVQENETKGLGDTAFENLIPKIIDAQSTDGIDVWTGATVSSEALFAAVNDAISKTE